MNPLDCKLPEGQRVLLNGAGGGIGTFAIQIAKARGARPVVGDVFPLDTIRDAHVRMQSGHARGKIVVRP